MTTQQLFSMTRMRRASLLIGVAALAGALTYAPRSLSAQQPDDGARVRELAERLLLQPYSYTTGPDGQQPTASPLRGATDAARGRSAPLEQAAQPPHQDQQVMLGSTVRAQESDEAARLLRLVGQIARMEPFFRR